MRSLRGRLTAWLLAGIALLLGACGVAVHAVAARRLQAEFDAALLSQAESLMTLTSRDRGGVHLDFADEDMTQFSARVRPWYFQLAGRDGAVIERSASLGGRRLPYSRTASRLPVFTDRTLPDGRPGRLVEISFLPQAAGAERDERAAEPAAGKGRGARAAAGSRRVTLTVARGREELLAALAALRWTLWSALALALLGTAAIVPLSLRLGLAPLAELAHQLRALDAATLAQRLAVRDLPSELAPVVAHTNDLLDRLRAAFERERSFSANVAHELRTPVGELRALSEVAMRWPGEAAAREEFFADVHGIGLQMERVVANLFALARLERGEQAIEVSRFPVRDAVLESWREVEAEARQRRVSLEMGVPPELVLATDRAKLRLILANLLSNAAAYSPEGAVVRCSATYDEEGFALALANPAPALAAADLPRIFDRFWRQDPARAGSSHSGLGLALVAAFCDLLELRREVSLAAGIFTLRLSGRRAPSPAPEPGRS
jgi:two-component system heavy metal sensor histidine kinase CusS